jgi:hypothetical protein
MGKSYKKNPIGKSILPGSKRMANKRVRRYDGEISNGTDYKKVYSSYDVYDQWYRRPYEEFISDAEAHANAELNGVNTKRFFSPAYYDKNIWARWYKRK